MSIHNSWRAISIANQYYYPGSVAPIFSGYCEILPLGQANIDQVDNVGVILHVNLHEELGGDSGQVSNWLPTYMEAKI